MLLPKQLGLNLPQKIAPIQTESLMPPSSILCRKARQLRAGQACGLEEGRRVIEEFTDVKHESEFSLETNFMEEESGDCNADLRDSNSSQAFSEGKTQYVSV